jgi:hypothetical protein
MPAEHQSFKLNTGFSQRSKSNFKWGIDFASAQFGAVRAELLARGTKEGGASQRCGKTEHCLEQSDESSGLVRKCR